MEQKGKRLPLSRKTAINDFISAVSERALSLQQSDGHMPSGHNGPYKQPETPVRNTAHWLITFSFMFRQTGEARYIEAVSACADYLISKEARPYGYTHHCRTTNGADRCNGLIGPAWVLEALCEATYMLSDTRFADVASEIFGIHPFDNENGLWTRIDIDGSRVGQDETFNHQLWFASCAVRLLPVVNQNVAERIEYRVRRFLDFVPNNIVVYDDGVVFHSLRPSSLKSNGFPRSLFALRKDIVHRLKFLPGLLKYAKFRLRDKSIGYHHFNTYAFATLREFLPQHELWDSSLIESIVNVLNQDWFQSAMLDSPYGYPYNSPLFLIPYSLQQLTGFSVDEIIDAVQFWKKQHVEYFGIPFGHDISSRTPDPATFEARVYELTRFSYLPRT